jgi:hypothetical protein
VSVYAISLFLHVVGALGIFAALGLEWAGLSNLRRATETSQVSGRRVGAIARALREGGGSPISKSLAQHLHDPALILGLRVRTALFLGIIFLMSTRPGWSGALAVMGLAVVAGVAAALPARDTGRRQTQMAGSER